MPRRAVYGYIHNACQHPASDHRLRPDADGIEGSYRCLHCECEMKRSDPVTGLNEHDFRAHMKAIGL